MFLLLFWFEIRNILIVNERRRRIDATDVERFLRELPKLILEVDEEPDSPAVMALARSHQLTVYDAAYLELAARRQLRIMYSDQQLVVSPQRGDRSVDCMWATGHSR